MRIRTALLVLVTSLAVVLPVGGATLARELRLPVRDVDDAIRASQPGPGTLPFLGVVTSSAPDGLRVARVVEGSAAERAGLRAGDVIRRLQGRAVSEPSDLEATLRGCAPGDGLSVSLHRDRKLVDADVTLGSRRAPERLFRGGSFRLAVIPLRFADDPADARPDPARLSSFFFAETGSDGAGASLRDYYAAQSLDALDVDGRVLAPLRLTQRRAHYASMAMGAVAGSPYREAARLLGEGRDARVLRGFDGIVFLYTGKTETVSGRALWPHRAVISVGGRRIPYYVHSAETVARGEIGEHCHEFGHLLGFADKYGVAHSTGAGDFCVMAIGHRGGASHGPAEPFSFCASCRVRIGWLPCVTVDPESSQRLRLPPADRRGARAVAVPLDRRTSEYLLLEVRAPRGFDAELPSTGLLVWRVGGLPTPGQGVYHSKIDLVEAHGVDTFDASLVRPREIAFPTARARDLTPTTVPSSGSGRDGSYDVHLTDIVREDDGAVVLTIGVAREVRQPLPPPYVGALPGTDGRVRRVDPITGEVVEFDTAALPAPATRPGTPSRR